jgi:uncharacterized protein (TIGR03067 family)
MRRFAFALVLFGLSLMAMAQPPVVKKKTDLELIQGSWWVFALESGGKQQTEKSFKGNTFTFSKTKAVNTAVLQERAYAPVEFAFKVDPTKSPKTIDLVAGGNTAHGIYKLEGDDLTICVSLGGLRPKDFTTRPGGDTETFTLRRNHWERYSDMKRFKFSIEFPGKPAETKRELDGPGGRAVATVLSVRSEMDRLSYSVTTLPVTDELDAMDAEATLDTMQKALVAGIDPNANPKVEPQAKADRLPAGILASREVSIVTQQPRSKDRTATRARIYLANERLYILAVSGTEEGMKSPNVLWFWYSFRTPADKSRNPPNK